MNSKINKIKDQIRRESERNMKLKGWWFNGHLLGVEKFAKEILRKFPKADKEVVMLSVWLHDLGRIRRIKGDHEKMGALEAGKVMIDFGYPKETIDKVKNIILTHSCEKRMPKNLEGKILSTADAMSHYYNDFFLRIACTGQRNIVKYKEWVLEKLERNYNRKLFFISAKKKIRKRHNLWKKLLNMG